MAMRVPLDVMRITASGFGAVLRYASRALIILALLTPVSVAMAQSTPPERSELATVHELFALPDKEIDLGEAKLLIDRVIDPSVDVSATLGQLDAIAAEIRAALPRGASSFDTAQYLRAYLYALGPWSGQTPFQYDLDDPYGAVLEHKLLHRYLATRKGNCVTMPVLFLILGQRLGLDVSAAVAPLHLFVKYTDPATGTTYNIEATDGAQAVDEDFYVEKLGISERAIETGVYLQALTAKEAVAMMMTLLCDHYEELGEWERSIVVAQIVLDHYPKCVYAMLKMGNAYAGLMDQLRTTKALRLSEPDVEQLTDLSTQNGYWFAKAEALGWHAPSQAEEAAYRASVRKRQDALH